jgi:two-component system, LytTR family, response regulator LytT
MKSFYHILFWIVITVVLTLIFGASWENYTQSFYFISMLLPIVVGTSYIFNFFLVPRYLLTGRYFLFGLYLLYTVIVSLYLEMVVLTVSFVYLANFNFGNMGSYASDSLILAIVLFLVVFTSSFILMVIQLYSSQKQIKSLKEEKERNNNNFLVVRADRKNRQVEYHLLLCIESRADYLILRTEDNEEIITREKISHVIKRLPDHFVRIHRSFIVNRMKITSFNHEEVQLGSLELPISRTYKESALSLLAHN